MTVGRSVALVAVALAAIIVGSLQELVAGSAATNLLPNPSFENGAKFPDGWYATSDPSEVNVFTADNRARSGKRAMASRITYQCVNGQLIDLIGPNASPNAVMTTGLMPVDPARTYEFSMWARAYHATGLPRAHASIRINIYDGGGSYIGGTYWAGINPKGPAPWPSDGVWHQELTTFGQPVTIDGWNYAGTPWPAGTAYVSVGIGAGWLDTYGYQCTSAGKKYNLDVLYDDLSFSVVDSSTPSYSLIWPFPQGKNWTITQGYNSTFSHKCPGYPFTSALKGLDPNGDCFGFDLVAADGSTAGTEIRAPVSGTVSYVTKDGELMCIDTKDGRSVKVGHLTSALGKGTTVTVHDTIIGKLKAAPLSSGTNPHLHISIYQGNGCLITSKSVATPVPFSGTNTIEGGPEFPVPNPFPVNSGGGYYKGTTVSSVVP